MKISAASDIVKKGTFFKKIRAQQILPPLFQTHLTPSVLHQNKALCNEHLGISALTGKRVKGDDDSAIKEHLLFCNYKPDFEDFSILATNNNDFKVTLMESLLINRDHPPLNKNKQSLPLELFDS